MSPEHAIVIAAGIGFVAVLCIYMAKYFKPQRIREAEETEDRIRQEVLEKAVEKGILNGEGKPLCKICGNKDNPDTVATQYDFRIERSENLWSWIRQKMGAQARIDIGRRKYDGPRLCRECALVMEQAYSSFLLGFEQQRRNQISDGEIELRYWERQGAYTVVKDKIDEHAKDIQRNKGKRSYLADVTSLRPNGTQ